MESIPAWTLAYSTLTGGAIFGFCRSRQTARARTQDHSRPFRPFRPKPEGICLLDTWPFLQTCSSCVHTASINDVILCCIPNKRAGRRAHYWSYSCYSCYSCYFSFQSLLFLPLHSLPAPDLACGPCRPCACSARLVLLVKERPELNHHWQQPLHSLQSAFSSSAEKGRAPRLCNASLSFSLSIWPALLNLPDSSAQSSFPSWVERKSRQPGTRDSSGYILHSTFHNPPFPAHRPLVSSC